MSNGATPAKMSANPFDIFVIGARKGFNMFGPAMTVFGLPGEAVTVILTAWLSSSASVGLAANMAANGILDATHITILMPCFFLLGAQLQYMGRLLGVADVPKKYWPLLMSASLLNALCAMLIMNYIFV